MTRSIRLWLLAAALVLPLALAAGNAPEAHAVSRGIDIVGTVVPEPNRDELRVYTLERGGRQVHFGISDARIYRTYPAAVDGLSVMRNAGPKRLQVVGRGPEVNRLMNAGVCDPLVIRATVYPAFRVLSVWEVRKVEPPAGRWWCR